jgi:hypothetical protein
VGLENWRIYRQNVGGDVKMDSSVSAVSWWCAVSVRICHAFLDPGEISELLKSTPQIINYPGQSKIHHGDCRSAGYWCFTYRLDSPNRPDKAILWAESFVQSRESELISLLRRDFDINIYIGVFSNVLALGFELPPTPTITELRIPIGMELFSK